MIRQHEIDLTLAHEDQPRLDPAYQHACAAQFSFIGSGVHKVGGGAARAQVPSEDPGQQARDERMGLS